MDLLKGELGSSNETRVTSTLVGNEVTGIEAESVSDKSRDNKISAIQTEPNMTSASLSYKRGKDMRSDPSVITSETRSINDLPDEILLNILSHFDPEELCLIIAKVCERWNSLARDVVLWKTLSYTCYEGSDISEIEEVLTNAPALHSLIIRDHNEDTEDILELLLHKRVDLRRLIINCWWLGENSNELFPNVVDLYPDLEGLSLESCYTLPRANYRLITRLKKLCELNLMHCQELSGETVRLIADSCQHLKNLSLGGCSQVLDEDIIHVIDRLGKQLTTFMLNGERFTDVAYSHLKNCARLQELGLSCCENMTDRGLLEGIGSLLELTSLRLTNGHNLTAQGLSTFLHRPSMTSIVSLKLRECDNLDDEGLKGIAKRCIRLEELAVCGSCNVTDAGIRMVISHCNQLRILNLMCLPSITGEGFLALVPSLLPILRELCLCGCDNVCDTYVEELVAAVPELDVYK